MSLHNQKHLIWAIERSIWTFRCRLVNTARSQQKQKWKKNRKGRTFSFRCFRLPRSFFRVSADSDLVLLWRSTWKAKIALIYKACPERADTEAWRLLMNTGTELQMQSETRTLFYLPCPWYCRNVAATRLLHVQYNDVYVCGVRAQSPIFVLACPRSELLFIACLNWLTLQVTLCINKGRVRFSKTAKT